MSARLAEAALVQRTGQLMYEWSLRHPAVSGLQPAYAWAATRVTGRDGLPIAGALNFIGPDALYGRYWGTICEAPFLHFELCYYRAIEWAIDHGLKSVQAGAQGEHKIARGYLPATTYSAHYIDDPGLRRAIGDFLERERAYVAAADRELSGAAPFRKE